MSHARLARAWEAAAGPACADCRNVSTREVGSSVLHEHRARK